MSGVTRFSSKGLIEMNALQCAVDRSRRLGGGGDEVDVGGGGQRAGVPVSKRKDGKGLRSQSRASHRFVVQRDQRI